MAITAAEVEKVALLARLVVPADQLPALTGQLSQIVAYVDLLAEVDTDQVEPMAHAVEMHNVTRPDTVAQSLSREGALANAPHTNSVGYLVPAVMGE